MYYIILCNLLSEYAFLATLFFIYSLFKNQWTAKVSVLSDGCFHIVRAMERRKNKIIDFYYEDCWGQKITGTCLIDHKS